MLNTGTCPILTRYITDLYSAAPDEWSSKIDTDDIYNVPIDEAYVSKRMFLCVDSCVRQLLPHVLSKKPQQLARYTKLFQGIEVVDLDSLILAHDTLQKLYVRLNNLTIRGPKAVRPFWLFVDGVAHAVQWTIEAAMCGSSVIGPMTVNVLDTMAEEFGWEEMFPYANQILNNLTKIQYFVN